MAFAVAFLCFAAAGLDMAGPYRPFLNPYSKPRTFLSLRPKPARFFSTPQSTAADLLALLGGPSSASRVPDAEAAELRSCLRFLAPLPADPARCPRELADVAIEDDLVLWPPEPVMELARLAVDSGGDPAAIHRSLDPTLVRVPDIEDLKKDKCQLTRTPYAWRFGSNDINSYFAFLFELIASRSPSVGLNVSLSRYDLFHGHIFLAAETGRLGILFHAREYPAYDEKSFPYNLGFCQTASIVPYDNSFDLRNILWLAPLPSNTTKTWISPGVLVVLDAYPDGIIYRQLVPDYAQIVRTVYEDDFGVVAADINYLNVANAAPSDKIYVC